MGRKAPPTAWKPGVSGNPGGRPGTATGELRRKLASHSPAIFAKCVEMAKAGDLGAMRLIMERTMPSLRPSDVEFALDLPAKASMSDSARAIFAAVGAGDVSAAQGSEMLQALASVAAVVRVDEITQRLDALEAVPSKRKRA